MPGENTARLGNCLCTYPSLGYQPLRKREQGSGNIVWNVVNVIFTMLWTATQVTANQDHCAHANGHSTTYWCDSKPIAHCASKYCTWRRCLRYTVVQFTRHSLTNLMISLSEIMSQSTITIQKHPTLISLLPGW